MSTNMLTREQIERIGYLTGEPEFARYSTPLLAAFAERVLTDPVLAARMQPAPDHALSFVQAANERAERAERMALIGRLYMAGVLRVHPDTMSPLLAARMQPAEQQHPRLTLTAPMLRAALGFVAPDVPPNPEQDEYEVTIGYLPDHEDGPGLCVWMTEYPEEGAMRIDWPQAPPLKLPPGMPDVGALHPETASLVDCFAAALKLKLRAAEQKYGYSDGWMRGDWMDECRAKLVEHVAKGDPRDVAAYCAFLWHHGASTAAPSGECPYPIGGKRHASDCVAAGACGCDEADKQPAPAQPPSNPVCSECNGKRWVLDPDPEARAWVQCACVAGFACHGTGNKDGVPLGLPAAADSAQSSWTLIAPDGRRWTGDSPLNAVSAEQRSRLTPEQMMQNIQRALSAEAAIEAERDAEIAALRRIRDAAQELYDNRLGWSHGRNPYAPPKFWADLGAALAQGKETQP